jgi:NAD(P)-dependent dehydrogenase (short-subunit alcohol dehydrogenase family)
VVAVARTAADLEETCAGTPDAIRPIVCDVADAQAVDELFDIILADLGRVDVLVCSHGIYAGGVPALELDLERFDRTMAVNVRGSLACAQRAGRVMRDGGDGGRIVFISSMNATASQAGAADYDASKAALEGLTRALAVDLAEHRITVNAIAPGWIRTPMSAEELEHLEREGLVMNPLHTVGTTADIARAALWLTDRANGFVTGAVIRVDGGQTAMLPIPWPADHVSIV